MYSVICTKVRILNIFGGGESVVKRNNILSRSSNPARPKERKLVETSNECVDLGPRMRI